MPIIEIPPPPSPETVTIVAGVAFNNGKMHVAYEDIEFRDGRLFARTRRKDVVSILDVTAPALEFADPFAPPPVKELPVEIGSLVAFTDGEDAGRRVIGEVIAFEGEEYATVARLEVRTSSPQQRADTHVMRNGERVRLQFVDRVNRVHLADLRRV